MSKILRWRLVDQADPIYVNNKFEEVEDSVDKADAQSILTIASPAAIVIWNDRKEDRYIPVFQGLGTKLLLHSNEYITITPGSVAEELFYFAAADDADVYCNLASVFNG